MVRRRSGTRGRGRAPLKKVGAKRMPARSSSARDEKRDQHLVRLNKFLADNGVASRRGSDELIESGKVLVDEQIVTELGTKIDPSTQVVDVNGVRLRSDPRERRYYLLHKPAGVVCTNEERETRPRAIDLITDPNKGRIFSVGRLDEESKGLIIMTSDGEFADRIAHPRFGVEKRYLVKVPGRITDEAVQKIRDGVHLAEGRTARARVLVQRRTANGSTLEVTIQEGKNREVRRVFARVGHKVLALTRTSIGPLTIRGLKEGRWRALSREEVEGLLSGTGPNGPENGAEEGLREGEEVGFGGARPRRGAGTRRSGGARRGGARTGTLGPGGARRTTRRGASASSGGPRGASRGASRSGSARRGSSRRRR
ncbi:Ribosomal large subunit pseudouridine synthase B [Planctomycetes bacterium Poly30]|uniref:Pseudouridine synthase n=1 Tax=Saltatorellus ferox TaxID=2528018 RepID=A0A518EZA5_9BACT|nr:Ribosomal large subunit pseudouridine synthase B [Planctomycetes bacterium Poly30]